MVMGSTQMVDCATKIEGCNPWKTKVPKFQTSAPENGHAAIPDTGL